MKELEAALIRRCQAGDKQAFRGIVKKHAGAAVGVAFLLLGNYEDALEASQDAFVRAWRHIQRFDSRMAFYPWFASILHNLCVDRLRRHPKAATFQLTDAEAAPQVQSDPVLLAERSELRDRIWRTILQLSPSHREIIVMKHFQEMSYKSIAASLGIPIGTVMSRLYHARQALRQKLSDEDR